MRMAACILKMLITLIVLFDFCGLMGGKSHMYAHGMKPYVMLIDRRLKPVTFNTLAV